MTWGHLTACTCRGSHTIQDFPLLCTREGRVQVRNLWEDEALAPQLCLVHKILLKQTPYWTQGRQERPSLTSRLFSSICGLDFVMSWTWPTELGDKGAETVSVAWSHSSRPFIPSPVQDEVWLSEKFHSIQFNQDSLRRLKVNNLIKHNPCP